jgi:hypothetical protein
MKYLKREELEKLTNEELLEYGAQRFGKLAADLLSKLEAADATPHHHKCPAPGCGAIWSHRASDFHSQDEHNAGHTCPTCGMSKFSFDVRQSTYAKCDATGRYT